MSCWYIPDEGAHTLSSSLLSCPDNLLSYLHSCLLSFSQSSCLRVRRQSCQSVRKATRPEVRPRFSLLPRGKPSPPRHLLLWEPLCSESLLLGHVDLVKGLGEPIQPCPCLWVFLAQGHPRAPTAQWRRSKFLPGPTFQSAVSTRSSKQDDQYVGAHPDADVQNERPVRKAGMLKIVRKKIQKSLP